MLTSSFSCFVTLTYDDAHLPAGAVLQKKDVQNWLKFLRKVLHPRRIRYFLVGEYGEQFERPHYHVILYGVNVAESVVISRTWTKGLSHVGTAERASLSYVCGYVLKKMTSKKDLRLKGRPPEFTLMSRKPGIGRDSIKALAAAYQTVQGKVALQRDGYVSRGVRIGSKVYPLGRYLVGHLASHLDLTEEDRKKANYQAMLKRAAEKMPLKTTDYERARKARVDQQAGRIGLETGSWKRKL